MSRIPSLVEQMPDGYIPAGAVCRIVGITERQLDYWCGLGVFGHRLQGDGSGIPRAFSPADVVKVAAARRMRDIGIDLARIRDALQQDRELVLVDEPLPEPELMEATS